MADQTDQNPDPDPDLKFELKPDDILIAEFEYIAASAFQANEDRARVASFYFVSVGSLVAAILGTQFANGLSPWVYRAFSLLFAVLTILGVLTVIQLARLRAAWYSSAEAMNAIKDFYIGQYPKLKKPIIWRSLPAKERWYSIANLLRIQVSLLGGMTSGAMAYAFLRSFSDEIFWWGWCLAAILPIGLYFLQQCWYFRLLKK